MIIKILSWLLIFSVPKKGFSSTVLLLLHTIRHARMILWAIKFWMVHDRPSTSTKMLFFDKNRWKTWMKWTVKWTSCYSGSWKRMKRRLHFILVLSRSEISSKPSLFVVHEVIMEVKLLPPLKHLPPCWWLFVIIIVFIFIINLNTNLFTGSNQPPRFLNYFFSTYLLIYEDMPVGESPWHSSYVTDHVVDRTWRQTLAMNSELFLCLLLFRDFSYRRDLKWLFTLGSHFANIHIHMHCIINLVIICQSAVLGEGSSVQLLPILPVFFLVAVIDKAIWTCLAFHHLSGCQWLGIKILYSGLIFLDFFPPFFKSHDLYPPPVCFGQVVTALILSCWSLSSPCTYRMSTAWKYMSIKIIMSIPYAMTAATSSYTLYIMGSLFL